jgi:hypothetical protein
MEGLARRIPAEFAGRNNLAGCGKYKGEAHSLRQLATQRLLSKLHQNGDVDGDYGRRLRVLARIERQAGSGNRRQVRPRRCNSSMSSSLSTSERLPRRDCSGRRRVPLDPMVYVAGVVVATEVRWVTEQRHRPPRRTNTSVAHSSSVKGLPSNSPRLRTRAMTIATSS